MNNIVIKGLNILNGNAVTIVMIFPDHQDVVLIYRVYFKLKIYKKRKEIKLFPKLSQRRG
jgi:hypothetical protein